MNYMTIPGIGLDADIIVDLISREFDLPDKRWVQQRIRTTHERLARQLLMTCLMDHMGYSLAKSGIFCNRNHSTAFHAKQVIFDTFWTDAFYGERVRCVYNRCIELKKRILV